MFYAFAGTSEFGDMIGESDTREGILRMLLNREASKANNNSEAHIRVPCYYCGEDSQYLGTFGHKSHPLCTEHARTASRRGSFISEL